MHRRSFLLGLLSCPVCAAAAAAEGPHWEYEGAAGPEKWGELDSSFGACAVGREQSPIDLKHAVKASIDRLTIDWKPQAFAVVNNGHTIQANAASGSSLAISGENYELKQFHFHTPSEHALFGKRSAMEAHFVHAQASGRLAVIGVLMVAGHKRGAFSEIMKAAPKSQGEAHLEKPLDPAQFLPMRRTLYRYAGSLTTPPCTEVVDWNVYEEPIEVAQADIDAFRAIFPMNARPLQPINRRFLLEGV